MIFRLSDRTFWDYSEIFSLCNVYLMKPSLKRSLFLYECVEFNEDEGIFGDFSLSFFFRFSHLEANVGLIVHRILKIVPADLFLH